MIATAARSMFVLAWANQAEFDLEYGFIDELPWSPGSELMDVAPDTPERFIGKAEHLLATTECDNATDLTEYAKSLGLSSGEFGHYIAMSALGQGVGLWEYDEGKLKVPLTESFVDSDEMGYEDNDDD